MLTHHYETIFHVPRNLIKCEAEMAYVTLRYHFSVAVALEMKRSVAEGIP